MQLKSKILSLVAAISLICVVMIILFLPHGPGGPDFLVDSATGRFREHPTGMSDFLLTFNVTNNGTASSANVTGAAGFQEQGHWFNTTWYWANSTQKGLAVGQRSAAYALFQEIPSESTKQFVIIVSCAERVQRKFNVTAVAIP